VRTQRALHLASAVLFVALAALVTGYVAYVWSRIGALAPQSPLALVQSLLRLVLPLLVLLVGLTFQFLHSGFFVVSVVRTNYIVGGAPIGARQFVGRPYRADAAPDVVRRGFIRPPSLAVRRSDDTRRPVTPLLGTHC
jgi:Zn-dependent protease with chaperone function